VLQEYDYGVLKRVKRADSPYTVYWEANTQDAFGNVIDEDLGNGTTTIRGFDGVTGRIDQINMGSGALQNLTYSWDKVGNLLSRKDWRQTGYPTEVFDYDSLNRLTDADVSGAATFNLGLQYDENGNIDVKDDVGTGSWTYHATNKHAVTSAGGSSYSYDANGNMTSRKGDTITWTSYNYPAEIVDGTRTYEYSYDADRQKWQQVYDNGSTAETTYFAGRIFEKNVNSSDTDHRHYIMANGRAVAMFVESASDTDYTRYFTHDHLGSTDGIVLDNGTLDVGESFSAWGERRDPVDWVGAPGAGDLTKIADSTDRGYTDHINLEQSALIHMNGRVFDAEIGRFLSPDPYVFHPMNTQGFNRYAYVQNNPMRYTDPSGFAVCGEIVSCTGAAIWTAIGFGLDALFGGDEPPPPDFCKDNTAGCGGVSGNSAARSFQGDESTLPNSGKTGSGEKDGLDRTIGDTEITDSRLRRILEILSGNPQIGRIGRGIPVTQELLDLTVEGILTAILIQTGLDELLNDLGEAGLMTVQGVRAIGRSRSVSHRNPELMQFPEGIPSDLVKQIEKAIENELKGLGQVARAGGQVRIASRLREILAGI
jgi:RHS repeat-associated protein